MAFDPRYPDTSNSLNRVVIADLPGLNLPDDIKGKTGYDLVSTAALDKLIEAHVTDLGLISYNNPAADREFFFVMLNHDDPTAIHITETIGRNLGYLLLTLIRGDEVNREARPEWDDSHWSLWGNMQTVHLGGGLVADKMGKLILKQVQAVIASSGSTLAVDIAHYSPILPLLGAARYIPAGRCGCVLDFGGTHIKRGLASFDESGFRGILLLPMPRVEMRADMSAKVIRVKMVDVIVDTLKGKHCDAMVIPISIAAYVDANGQPLIAQGGIYMKLTQLSDDVPSILSDEVSKRIGKQVQIKLLHDGSAAASYYAPEENAAVVMIGTAIGSGYCVARPELRALSPHLSIVDVRGG
jgi:hypothetical protein